MNADYLRKEFNLISRKLPANIPEVEHWRSLMDKHQKLDVVFSSIVIPMVCTYNSDIFNNHCEETDAYFNDFVSECTNLNETFNRLKGDITTEIILMLLPVPDKDILNTELDKRLKFMQQI